MSEPAVGRTSLIRATALNALVTLATTMLMLARSKVSAVVLGPEGFGTSAVLNQWIQLFGVGASAVTGPALIGALAKAGREETARVLKTAAAFVLLSSLGATGLAMVAEWAVGTRGHDAFGLLALSGLASLFAVAGQLPQSVLVSRQRLGRMSALVIATTAITAGAVVLGTWRFGLWGQFVGAALGALVNFLVVGAVALDSGLLWEAIRARIEPAFVRRAFAVGATSLVAALAMQGSLTSIRLALERSSGAAGNGLFQAAWALNATAFAAITGGLATYAFPRFGAATTPDQVSREVSSSLRFILRLSLPMAFIGLAVHDLAMPLLFSNRFDGAIPLIALLIVGNVARSAVWVFSGPLLYRGRVKAFLTIELLGAAALGVAIPVLLPHFGLSTIGAVYVANSALLVPVSAYLLAETEQFPVPWRLAGGSVFVGIVAVAGYACLTAWSNTRWVLLLLSVTLLLREGLTFKNRRRVAVAG